jgi:hypothetical protein
LAGYHARTCRSLAGIGAIYAARFPVHQVIGAAERCPRMPEGVAFPPGLAGFTPGRRLDEIMLESFATTYGE